MHDTIVKNGKNVSDCPIHQAKLLVVYECTKYEISLS